MRDVVVLGVGLHKFGRFPEKGLGDFGREAGLAALKDAGVDYKDIEAGFCGRVYDRVYAGLEVIQQVPAVLGGAEEMDPGAVGAAGAPGGLAVHRHRP